jgi:hypothetical protein
MKSINNDGVEKRKKKGGNWLPMSFSITQSISMFRADIAI